MAETALHINSENPVDLGDLRYDDRGLITVVVQDVATGTVLMVAWADREAVKRTLESGQGWFWSRSRQELWHKGATSGNTLEVVEVRADCDADTLLYRVHPAGPTCHRGSRSCFEPPPSDGTDDQETGGVQKNGNVQIGEIELGWLWRVLESRKGAPPDSSYTARLLHKGRSRIAQKVVEEAGEVVIASLTMPEASADDPAADDPIADDPADELIGEAADLLYHTLVLLLDAGVPPRRIAERLIERHRPAGGAP